MDELPAPPLPPLPAAEPPPVKVLPRAEHSISRSRIDKDALWVLYTLHRAGHRAYLVGGGVRDLLLGLSPKDFDIGTCATPEDVKRIIRRSRIIGKRFRLAHVPFGAKKFVEISTFRRQATAAGEDGELLVKDDNLYGTPREDAFRRDFTVNGLFYNIADFSVVDYVGGLADLDRRLIRSIGDPHVRFREDPVRMVRAVKFAARIGFEIAPEDRDAIRAWAPELQKSPPSRVVEECYRVIERENVRRAVELLWDLGLFAVLFPGLVPTMEDPAKRDEVLRRLSALEALDRVKYPFSRGLAFLTLVSVAAEDAIRRAVESRKGDWTEAGRAAIDGAGGKLPFTRIDRATALHALVLQRRLERGVPRKGAPGFLGRPSFAPGVSYYWIRLKAAGADAAPAEQWREWAGSAQGDLVSAASAAAPKPRRRRGRRRRRGGGHPAPSHPGPVPGASGGPPSP